MQMMTRMSTAVEVVHADFSPFVIASNSLLSKISTQEIISKINKFDFVGTAATGRIGRVAYTRSALKWAIPFDVAIM